MKNKGLYHPSKEHSSCGVGFVANINGNYSRNIIEDGLDLLQNLVHRGAVGSDAKTGDGAGIKVRIPHDFFSSVLDFRLPNPGRYGIASLFISRDKKRQSLILNLIREVIREEEGRITGSRKVPVNPDCLGKTALDKMPDFMQLFVEFPGFS
ncbi:MAG: hypothetical protein ACQEQC_08915, partial [Elusimicrobiota bacterium]